MATIPQRSLLRFLMPKYQKTIGDIQFRTATTKNAVHSMIRVNHAGELAADRIYAGQMAVLQGSTKAHLIRHMWEQEKVHRAKFEQLVRDNRVRPTVMVPVWNVAGFLLGAATAAMGERAAMACTVAVETTIVEHYNDQLRQLLEEKEEEKLKHRELIEVIRQFRDEEQEHHDTGIANEAELAPFYQLLSKTIQLGCKGAIALSKVI